MATAERLISGPAPFLQGDESVSQPTETRQAGVVEFAPDRPWSPNDKHRPPTD